MRLSSPVQLSVARPHHPHHPIRALRWYSAAPITQPPPPLAHRSCCQDRGRSARTAEDGGVPTFRMVLARTNLNRTR